MSGTRNAAERERPTTEPPHRPTLEPDERLWLESYLERLKTTSGGLLKRFVVYGSKARGDAGPPSDVDILVLVGGTPDAVRKARNLIYGDDDPDGVDHNVVVRTEADWSQDMEKELPFPRNVEAEGVQIHPVHQPARRPPGDRPPVTRKGIQHALPVWLKGARSDLKALRYEIKELKDGRFKHPGMAARPAFDPVFFEYRPWPLTAIRQLAGCLVRGERVPGGTTAQQLTHVGGAGADVVTGEPLRERGGESDRGRAVRSLPAPASGEPRAAMGAGSRSRGDALDAAGLGHLDDWRPGRVGRRSRIGLERSPPWGLDGPWVPWETVRQRPGDGRGAARGLAPGGPRGRHCVGLG